MLVSHNPPVYNYWFHSLLARIKFLLIINTTCKIMWCYLWTWAILKIVLFSMATIVDQSFISHPPANIHSIRLSGVFVHTTCKKTVVSLLILMMLNMLYKISSGHLYNMHSGSQRFEPYNNTSYICFICLVSVLHYKNGVCIHITLMVCYIALWELCSPK